MTYKRKTVKRWKNGDVAQLSSTAEFAVSPPLIGTVMLCGGNEVVLETRDGLSFVCTTRDLQLPTNVTRMPQREGK